MKRWQYLLFSTALAVIVLSVGTGSYLAIVRQERLEALEQTERDAEIYLEQLREARDQLREAEERLEALEDMLLNLHQMQQIAERSAAPSRGGRITLATMPLTTPSGFTAERLEMALAGTALAGLGQGCGVRGRARGERHRQALTAARPARAIACIAVSSARRNARSAGMHRACAQMRWHVSIRRPACRRVRCRWSVATCRAAPCAKAEMRMPEGGRGGDACAGPATADTACRFSG